MTDIEEALKVLRNPQKSNVIPLTKDLVSIKKIPPGSGIREFAGGPFWMVLGLIQRPGLENFVHYQIGTGPTRNEKWTSVNHKCKQIGDQLYQIVTPTITAPTKHNTFMLSKDPSTENND